MRAIIVEDEFPARKELRYFIENKSGIEVVSEFTNGIEVLDFIQENKIDVIFLDIIYLILMECYLQNTKSV